MTPETRYARSGEVHIAYQVVGEGSIDLVYVPSWISQVEHYWEEPTVARYFERLASFSRLIMFDRRGSGLSDHLPRVPTLEEQMDDVVAVMDAVDSERAAIFAWLEGGAMAALFAATHPERTTALVLYEAMARMSWAPDYDWALRREEREAGLRYPWGDGSRILALAPRAAGNQRLVQWFARLERLAASPGTAAKLVMMNADVDVRAILPSISAPTPRPRDVRRRPPRALSGRQHSRCAVPRAPRRSGLLVRPGERRAGRRDRGVPDRRPAPPRTPSGSSRP
jgi:pimeloyl-ACP methyl ester carboxylesterase